MIVRMDGTYQTRDGRGVKILCVDGPNPAYPVVGIIVGDTGACLCLWTSTGEFACGEDHSCDLVPVLREHQGWMVMSTNGFPEAIRIYPSREEAELAASMVPGGRAIPITWFD